MKYLNGEYYVEVKNHRCKLHPTENIILRKRDPPTSLRTQYQVQNKTQIGRIREVNNNDNDELIVRNSPKSKKNNQLFNNRNSNHLIVRLVNKIIG